jgi:hypothetical protein
LRHLVEVKESFQLAIGNVHTNQLLSINLTDVPYINVLIIM